MVRACTYRLFEVILSFLLFIPFQVPAQDMGHDDMVFVEGGTFVMGCRPDETHLCSPWEKPAHRVTLGDFYISKYPVTNEQFCVFLNDTELTDKRELFLAQVATAATGLSEEFSKIKYVKGEGYVVEEGFAKHPVTGVNYQAAKSYAYWLREKSGFLYRLPTESEWEYAARGGKLAEGFRYSGSDVAEEVSIDFEEGGYKVTSAVGQYKANELGLHDMTGNVFEWCLDWYKGVYPVGPLTDPQGPEEGRSRVIRGGLVWVGHRDGKDPAKHESKIGFRLARTNLKWITD